MGKVSQLGGFLKMLLMGRSSGENVPIAVDASGNVQVDIVSLGAVPTSNLLDKTANETITGTWDFPATGLTIGSDVLLKRSAANVLELGTSDSLKLSTSADDYFVLADYIDIVRTADTNPIMTAQVSGDSAGRFKIRADGRILWGNGTDVFDTYLDRSAADILYTPDTFDAGAFKCGGVAGLNETIDTDTYTQLTFTYGICTGKAA